MTQKYPQKPDNLKWLLLICVFGLVISTGWKMLTAPAIKPETVIIPSGWQGSSTVDKQADKVLKQMSDYLTNLKQFSYKTNATQEAVKTDNKKIKTTYSSEVHVKRPNKLRSDVKSENKDASVYYDGKNFAILGKVKNMYAQAPAPATLDQALDAAREELQLDPPGADIIYTNPYEGLMQDVTSGKYLGEEKVNGTACHHLSFKGKEVDWEIWVQKGDKPLPLKYHIVTKNLPEKPEFTVEFSDWKTGENAAISDLLFAFTPPKDAQKITFMAATQLKAKKQK